MFEKSQNSTCFSETSKQLNQTAQSHKIFMFWIVIEDKITKKILYNKTFQNTQTNSNKWVLYQSGQQ